MFLLIKYFKAFLSQFKFKLHHRQVYELYFTNQVRVENTNEQKPCTESANETAKETANQSHNSKLLKRFLSIRL